MAASIPILRALLRDGRPPPGPADFYHSFDLYTGTENSRGTGRSSTIITSGSRSTSQLGREYGHFRQLSKLSRFSGISMGFSSHSNSNRNSDSGPEPPPGKIIQTEEVSVEYTANEAQVQNQWAAIGKAI